MPSYARLTDLGKLDMADRALRALAGDAVEISSAGQIRAASLRIFDRSFAVTYWLQGVAIAIGLFGIAASFSAQVLARRKEFGLLAHLGFTRAQVLAIVAGEGAAWTAIGAVRAYWWASGRRGTSTPSSRPSAAPQKPAHSTTRSAASCSGPS